MIFAYTKFYSHREKAGISFEISNEKIRLFLSIQLLSGYHKLPNRKIYWEATPDSFVKARCDSCLVMSSSVFLGIFTFLTTNNLINKTKRLTIQIGDF